MAHYFDSSALVRLVVPSPHSAALHRWWARAASRAVSSQIARTEVIRAVRRTAPATLDAARELLDDVVLTTVTLALLDSAARLDPLPLRSLDAIHLATALDLGGDLEGFVTYDERLADAARRNGMAVVSPR
jgi:predicted nucleic acid-binding protein